MAGRKRVRSPVIRTTPARMHSRDGQLFPEAARAQRERGCPRFYSVRVDRHRVVFEFDAFFLPPEMESRLDGLYREYLQWWLARGNAARNRLPPHGIVRLRSRDFAMFTVLREHAEWWLRLFRELLPLTYNRWQVEREARRASRPAGAAGGARSGRL